MNLARAQKVADRVVELLAPWCQRIEIAGSIRRQKPEVGDIEVVCIPRLVPGDLFGDPNDMISCPEFCSIVRKWRAIKGIPEGKYTQRILPTHDKLDLFMATPENWGYILAVRTGSAKYSHEVLGAAWCRAGYNGQGGMLVKDGKSVPVREEKDLFELIGVPWCEPWERNL